MSARPLFAVLALSFALTATASDPYTSARAENAPMAEEVIDVITKDGKRERKVVQTAPSKDTYGNADGNQFDLVVDGAFEGQTVAVIHLYSFSFDLPKQALAEKGFSTYRWNRRAPEPKELAAALEKSNQLWVIADCYNTHLTDAHLDVIESFFNAGHGVYIWGDNDPCYSDANLVAERLLGVSMTGDLHGDQVVGLASADGSNKGGLARNHDITTGLEHLYEGITVATIETDDHLQPIVTGSAGNTVTAVYDRDGKRAIVDGGFTRLYNKWDTAGTARYVKNAAAWLANYERHGDSVLSQNLKTSPTQ